MVQGKTTQRCLVEYIWLGGNGDDFRAKTKVMDSVPKDASECSVWNYDGSSTNQAEGHDSEVFLYPARLFEDPFRGAPHKLLLCECRRPDGTPIPGNTRVKADAIFEEGKDQQPWFGLEQEYTMFKDGAPVGWPKANVKSFGGPCVTLGYPGPQGPYYCSVGADVAFGRPVADDHIEACLVAGVKVSGLNAEVMPGQWEFQVGPCEGIESGDHVMMGRYLLHRVGEKHGVVISFDPKPIPGDWNGAGMHANFSTKAMREKGGYKVILDAVERLAKKHTEHMINYGDGNERRMTGKHETASYDKFSYGVANRGASIRIPRSTEADDCGYFEDRRPASNGDPYTVSSMLFQTSCL